MILAMGVFGLSRENIKNAKVVIDMPKVHIGLEPSLSEINPAIGAEIITISAGIISIRPECIVSMPRTILRSNGRRKINPI